MAADRGGMGPRVDSVLATGSWENLYKVRKKGCLYLRLLRPIRGRGAVTYCDVAMQMCMYDIVVDAEAQPTFNVVQLTDQAYSSTYFL